MRELAAKVWHSPLLPLVVLLVTGPFSDAPGQHGSTLGAAAFALGLVCLPVLVRNGRWFYSFRRPLDPELLRSAPGSIRDRLLESNWLLAAMMAAIAGTHLAQSWHQYRGLWPAFALLGALSGAYQRRLWQEWPGARVSTDYEYAA